MSAIQSWLGALAANMRSTRSGGRLGSLISPHGMDAAPAMTALETRALHEARDALAPRRCPRARQFGTDARDAVRPVTRLMDRQDALHPALISPRSRRGCTFAPSPIAARGDTQYLAEPHDGVIGLLPLDELVDPHRSEPVSCAGDAP
jgi:hypothetical protein